jgi:LCP family protein required for cell wall assembly
MDDFEERLLGGGRSAAEPPPTIYKSRRHLRSYPRPGRKEGRAKVARPHGRRRWPWIVLATCIVLLAVVIAFGGWFFIALKAKEPRMRVASVDSVLKKPDGGPETTLIMGTDHGSVPGEEGPGRSDVLMLLTIAPGGNSAGFISIPRDSRVQIPGHKGYDKINAAHAYGGPALAIQTVEQVTGLDVNHWVELNFQGFKDMVNAVGGVHMNIPHAIHDKYAGDVPAGDVILTGDQALALVRARYDVKAVPNGDFDRQKNQRAFIEAMLSAVSHQRSPFKIMKIADVVSKTINRAWYFILNTTAFEQMLSKYKTGARTPSQTGAATDVPTGDPTQLRVKVLNGTKTGGIAISTAKKLTAKGYEKITTGNSKSPYVRTTVYYAPGYDTSAQAVASAVGNAPAVVQNEDVTTNEYESDVVVVLGSDYL